MTRADRILIAVALLVLCLAAGMLSGVDSFFTAKDRSESEAIAEIVTRSGDVRVKFNDQLHWQSGKHKQKLVFNDAVFSGPNSKVDLKVGQSKLTLDSNTMVILRKDQLFKSLNLNYGMLSGVLAKNERLVIETSGGEKFELNAKESSKIEIVRNGARTAVKVLEGNANVIKNGKTQTLSSRDKLEMDDKKPKRADPIVFEAPTQVLVYSNADRQAYDFRWRYSSGREIQPGDRFVVEFANDPSFKALSMKDEVLGLNRLNAQLLGPAEVYYRVKDFNGNFSEAKRLSLRRPLAPRILLPNAGSNFEVDAGKALPIDFQFDDLQPDSRFWFQVARDPEFKDMVYNRTFLERRSRQALPMGTYFARVKAVYRPNTLQSAWSEPTSVTVREKLDPVRLTRKFPQIIRIPNRPYPGALYSAKRSDVQNYLKQDEVFREFFGDYVVNGYELVLNGRRTDELPRRKTDPSFPAEWIKPGTQAFEYYLQSEGAARTSAKTHIVRIDMEAPNRLSGSGNGELAWSPILFAAGYDGELRDSQGTVSAFKAKDPFHRVEVAVGQKYQYRVRATDAQGRAISDWSGAHVFASAPAIQLAEKKPTPRERKPTAVEEKSSSTVKLEKKYVPWEKIGYWLWTGSGFNYFNVRQTVANTADVEYKNTHGPSMFVEAGYMSPTKRLGGVFAFKRTPGQVRVDNYPVAGRDFNWDTFSLEMLYGLPLQSRFLNKNINWGLRGGMQYHSFPFLYIETGNRLLTTQNQMMSASLGFYAETDGRWKHHWHMRYQHPVKSSSDGGSFEVTPTVAFDGSVGTSYLLTDHLKTGLFWYGQLHSYDFVYRSGAQTNSGTQSLFYSNMELRLGWDF